MVNSRLFRAAAMATVLACAGCVSNSKDSDWTTPPPTEFAAFPAGWEGDYAGELEIMGADRVAMRAGMNLSIHPTDSPDRWTWVMQYEGQPEREYELVVVNEAIGHYRIDEKNSIVIDGRLMGDTFLSPFGMESTMLSAKYQIVPEGIRFEIVTTSLDPISPSKAEGDMPSVVSYPVQGYQRALLYRLPEEGR
jgi:hypothetical protein